MNRELLEKQFLDSEIKQREGNHGKLISYLEGHTVISRLNESFGGEWSFEVTEYGIDEANDEICVLGKLTAENVVKMQFGSTAITRNKQTKAAVSIGDDYKKCVTDCIKKCATLFGVGLHLYGEKTEPRTQPAPSPDYVPAPSTTTPAPSPGRLSSKQHSYLLTLSRGHGLTRREVDALCIERFGVVLDHVTRSEASLMIEEFNSMEAAVPSQAKQQPERQTVGGVH